MAIIVLQHTIADNFPVDPNWNVTVQGPIYAGALVGLTSSVIGTPDVGVVSTNYAGGYLAPANNTTVLPLGISGDSIADEYETTAYSASLVISPTGKTRWTQNRIDNYFDETAASGMMTVYTTGGRFGTDQYVNGLSYNPGSTLYSTSAGLFTTSNPGSGRSCGYVLSAPGAYPSGVPGVDSPSVINSMSLGTYLFVQLSI